MGGYIPFSSFTSVVCLWCWWCKIQKKFNISQVAAAAACSKKTQRMEKGGPLVIDNPCAGLFRVICRWSKKRRQSRSLSYLDVIGCWVWSVARCRVDGCGLTWRHYLMVARGDVIGCWVWLVHRQPLLEEIAEPSLSVQNLSKKTVQKEPFWEPFLGAQALLTILLLRACSKLWLCMK